MALKFIYDQNDKNTKKDSKFGIFVKYMETFNYEVLFNNGYGNFLFIDTLDYFYDNKQKEKMKKRSVKYISTLNVIYEKSEVTNSTKINKITSRKSILSNLSAMENVIKEKDTEEEEKDIEEEEKNVDLCLLISIIITGCVAFGIIIFF